MSQHAGRGVNTPTVALTAGYVLLLVMLFAAWNLKSAGTIGAIAFFTVALTALVAADFSKFSMKGPGGLSFDAERLLLEKVAEMEEGVLRVATAGRVVLKTGAQTQGQGHETTFAEIVSDELGIPQEDILAQHGDTDSAPFRRDSERERREAAERLIRPAAEWGWLMAKMGFDSVPDPVILWENDGTPRILLGEGRDEGEDAIGRALRRHQQQGPSAEHFMSILRRLRTPQDEPANKDATETER